MTAGILVYGLAAGVLGSIAAWALATVLRLGGQPERAAWGGALLLVAAVSLLPVVPGVADEARAGAVATYRVIGELDPESVGGAAAGRSSSFDMGIPIPWAGTIWMGLSASLLVLGLAAEIRHRRHTGALRRARIRGMTVWMSEREGPAICGAIAPRLVLPERIRELDPRRRALVLTHEAEHLRAGDPQLNALAFLAVVVVPWNPFVWWIRSRLARALESDCDRRALDRRGVERRDYAEVLLTVASWGLGSSPAPLRLAMGRSARELRDRLERVLSPTPPKRWGALAGVLLLAVGAAAPALTDPPAWARAPAGIVERAAPGGRATLSERAPQGGAATGGSIFRVSERGLRLGPPPNGADRRTTSPGLGAFTLRAAADGGISQVTAEAVEGDEAFVSAAIDWLRRARVGSGSEGGVTRVWVSVTEQGSWTAIRISDALYEREGLALNPERALELIGIWAALGGGSPEVSAVTRVETGAMNRATYEENR